MRRIGPHNHAVISVIVGSLLGDGYAYRKSGEGVRICFRQGAKHKEYLFWLYHFFYSQGYTSNLEPREYTRKIKHQGHLLEKKKHRNPPLEHKGYEFNTFTFRSLNWIYEFFYKKGNKKLKPQIADYLTPLTLAVWIMDNGSWTKYGVRIATNHFTLSEVTLLSDILRNKYHLDIAIQRICNGSNCNCKNSTYNCSNCSCSKTFNGCKTKTNCLSKSSCVFGAENVFSLHKTETMHTNNLKMDRYSIYITKHSIPALISIILPYMHKSMHYKLGLV